MPRSRRSTASLIRACTPGSAFVVALARAAPPTSMTNRTRAMADRRGARTSGPGKARTGTSIWLPRAGGSRGSQTEENRPTDPTDGLRPASRNPHHRWSEGVRTGRRTLRSRPMANRVNREDFGPNTWLVEELYRQYVTDPESVSE